MSISGSNPDRIGVVGQSVKTVNKVNAEATSTVFNLENGKAILQVVVSGRKFASSFPVYFSLVIRWPVLNACMHCHQGYTGTFVFHTPKYYATVFGYKFFPPAVKGLNGLRWDKRPFKYARSWPTTLGSGRRSSVKHTCFH